MKITSWSLSSSSQWEPLPSSWWWWGPSCAHGAPPPTRKSKKHRLTKVKKRYPNSSFLLASCHPLCINTTTLSSLPPCSLLQKASCFKVLKRLPQIQRKLQRPEATRSLDSPREAGAQTHGQITRPQPSNDRNTHPPHLAGHHAGRQRPGQQPTSAAAAQLLPWSVLPRGKT